jgi:hypothetical protein
MEQSKKKPAKRVSDSELVEKLFHQRVREHVKEIARPIREKKKSVTRPK